MELWELAAASGVHLIETWKDHDDREIVAKAQAYYEETREIRDAKLAGYSERRKQRALERKRQKVT